MECPLCATAHSPMDGEVVWVRCDACGALIFREVEGPEVLVAHDADAIAQLIGVALIDARFAPIRVENGDQVLRLLRRRRAPAVVLDVALTAAMSFEVIETIRTSEELRHTKVVLVASVFNKTAYKRRPKSLHGADAYVEQHHITDMLPEHLAELLGRPAPLTRRLEEEARQRILDGHARIELSGPARVRALARSIVADVALYHEGELRRTAAGEESRALAAALDEGRTLLQRMVTTGERGSEDPIAEALADVIRSLGRDRER